MKILLFLATALFLGLANGFSAPTAPAGSTNAGPQTVMVKYRPIAGKEVELKQMLSRAWESYRTNNQVLAEPHILVQDSDEDGKPVLIEIFTWVTPRTKENFNETWSVWREINSFCELRSKQPRINSRNITLLVPSK